VFVPLINTVLRLGAPVLPTRWVKISTYLQSEPLLSITFIPINLKLLLIFVNNPNVPCYVVLSYLVLVTSLHLCLFVCLFACFICISVFSSSNACLYVVSVHNVITYIYAHCAVSVIGLRAVDSAHK
jgi:hypothetical protein